jgi:hypothetical protein
LSDVWQLNVDTLEWTCATASYGAAEPAVAGEPPAVLPPCAGMVALAHRGRILVVGGHTKDKNARSPLLVRALDPARGCWSLLQCDGDVPTTRGGHGAAVIGDKVRPALYLPIAGSYQSQTCGHLYHVLHAMPNARDGLCQVSIRAFVLFCCCCSSECCCDLTWLVLACSCTWWEERTHSAGCCPPDLQKRSASFGLVHHSQSRSCSMLLDLWIEVY